MLISVHKIIDFVVINLCLPSLYLLEITLFSFPLYIFNYVQNQEIIIIF
jgi:hypothetical protein